jgi:hypothetical protein
VGSLCVFPIVARQRLGEYFPRGNEELLEASSSIQSVCISESSLWVCHSISLSLLNNNSLNTCPRQRTAVVGVVFYAVLVVSKESRRLADIGTTCYKMGKVDQKWISQVCLEQQKIENYSTNGYTPG